MDPKQPIPTRRPKPGDEVLVAVGNQAGAFVGTTPAHVTKVHRDGCKVDLKYDDGRGNPEHVITESPYDPTKTRVNYWHWGE